MVRYKIHWDPRILLPCILLFHLCTTAMSQTDEVVGDVDTLFVRDLSHLLTGRVYTSTKYNAIRIGDLQGEQLIYRPTNQYNIGLGASYRKFTLNLGVGIPYLTYVNRERLGRSRYLDAQANIFGADQATNLFLQFWKGYRLTGTHAGSAGPTGEEGNDAFRDDIEQANFGISTLRVLNSKRFSYRAPMFHDAWQKRSQGSWLLGGHLTYYRLRADSALIPMTRQADFSRGAAMRKADLVDIGPMGGYTATIVVDRRFYLVGSLAIGAGAGFQYREFTSRTYGENGSSGTSWAPVLRAQLRGGIGYNHRRSQIALSFNHEHIHHMLPSDGMIAWSVGNIRFNIVHRFDLPIRSLDRLFVRLRPRTHPIIHEAIPAIKEAEVQ